MERLGIEGPGSAQLDVAAEHADLGLPPPRRSVLRRLMARASWSTSRHQVTYNHAIVEAIAALSHAVEVTRTATASEVGNRLGTYQDALTEVQLRLGELAGLLDVREVDLADVRARLAEIAQRLSVTKTAARDEQPPRVGAELEPRSVDEALMVALEDRFRPPDERRRAADDHLLAVVAAAGDDGAVLDLGCGTGEWLAALEDAGVEAHGVDTSALAVERCEAAGLDVSREDALERLKRTDEASLAVITAFHLAEHLSATQLVDLFDFAVRALRPGGLLVVETPNPMNLRVGAATFWLDPTHQRPLPPALLEFIARHRGFDELEVRLLHATTDDLDWGRVEGSAREELDPFASRLVDLLSGAQDYALYARRAEPSATTD